VSGIDEQDESEDYNDFPICHHCASRSYKRDWRDLGTATIEMEDGELLAAYHSAEDFDWYGRWRCAECGEEPNDEDQQILRDIFMEDRDG